MILHHSSSESEKYYSAMPESDGDFVLLSIVSKLQADPFTRSKDICRDMGISSKRLIDLYSVIRYSKNIQELWRRSAHASFFSIAGDLMCRSTVLERVVQEKTNFPLFIEYHSGGPCPLNCCFCYNRGVNHFKDRSQRSKMLTSSELRRLIDEVADEGAVVLNIAGGGEPLNDPVVLENILHAKDRGLWVALNTMGGGLSNDLIAEKILQIDQLRISLNAATAGTYEIITGKGRNHFFEKVCRAIKNLVWRRNRTAKPIHIVISFIVVPENFTELEQMVDLSLDLGVDCVYIRPDYVNISRPFNDRELLEIRTSVDKIKDRVADNEFPGLNVSIGDIFDRSELGNRDRQFLRNLVGEHCCAHRFKIGIDAWGNVHRCALVTQPGVGQFKHMLGCVRDRGSIAAIVRSEQKLPDLPVLDCQGQGITCNVFEGYFNALIAKLREDNEFGVQVAQQPFAQNSESIFSVSTAVEPKYDDVFAILQEESGRNIVTQWLWCYPNAGLPHPLSEIDSLVGYLTFKDVPNYKEKIRQFPILESMRKAYESAYEKLERIPTTALGKEALFREYIKGPIVGDVGCGWNVLGEAILRNNPKVERVIGFDIEAQRPRDLPERVLFSLMPGPLTLPMPSGSLDTVILSFVLHHLDVDVDDFLDEIHRVLVPGGRILVMEDTFSTVLKPGVDGEISKLFYGLSSDDLRFSFLAFADWFIHEFVNTSRRCCKSGKYRTMEQWQAIFKKHKFSVAELKQLGFASLGSRNPVSRGFFVLENASNGE